ncbi:hypothetical protein DVV91_10100 [Clostridium botulinum]|uniref:hypothetical protein n=1 Tax=Clostridium botulinum TaxID=1491 RepID=UPI00196827CA|nr:hypothetical protein [Clostridium botulinum]MBN1074693.1 hypothetical protein [Clostridium botulinum]
MSEQMYKIKLTIRAILIRRIFNKIIKIETRLLKQNNKIMELNNINEVKNIGIRSNVLKGCDFLLDSSDMCLEAIDMIDEEIKRSM